ncbi:MAG: phage holin family protein [Patescibacteria group bacterium]|nr:phage holin family protein [Candidatus Beckwithbacteria bacterium]MDZ4228907.1 phage holin family protein [Patescibacteria group bacterium]
MRAWLSQSLISSLGLLLVGRVYPGLLVPADLLDLFWIGVVFTLLNQLAKPIIKLILLPLNLLTLGLLSWVSQVLVLVITVNLLPTLRVVSFVFPGLNQAGFSISSFTVSLFASYILASLALSLTNKILNFVICPD